MLSRLCSRIRTDFRRCDFKYSMPVMIQVLKPSPNRNENEAQEVRPVTQARVWAQTSLCCQTSHITGEEGVKEGVCEQAWCSADILAASGLCPDPLPHPHFLLLYCQQLNAAQLSAFESSDPLTFWEKSWVCSQLLTDFRPWPPSRTWKLGLNTRVLCVTLCICGLKWDHYLQSHRYHAFHLNATRRGSSSIQVFWVLILLPHSCSSAQQLYILHSFLCDVVSVLGQGAGTGLNQERREEPGQETMGPVCASTSFISVVLG